MRAADLIVCEGSPATLARAGHDAETLRRRNPSAAIVLISPFGQIGPRAEEPATDLTLFFASGIARMLTGQVDDLDEPPMSPRGSAVGVHRQVSPRPVRACMRPCLGNGAVVDVSIHEALATLAITELARAGQTGKSWSRKRVGDGNGATVCILPASDGYAAISPREDRQWASWLEVMGSPGWGREPRFATQEGPGRQLGRAARADVGLEPRQAQTLDRRGGSGGARSEFSAVRAWRSTKASPQLRHRRVLPDGVGGVDGRCRCRDRRSGCGCVAAIRLAWPRVRCRCRVSGCWISVG